MRHFAANATLTFIYIAGRQMPVWLNAKLLERQSRGKVDKDIKATGRKKQEKLQESVVGEQGGGLIAGEENRRRKQGGQGSRTGSRQAQSDCLENV